MKGEFRKYLNITQTEKKKENCVLKTRIWKVLSLFSLQCCDLVWYLVCSNRQCGSCHKWHWLENSSTPVGFQNREVLEKIPGVSSVPVFSGHLARGKLNSLVFPVRNRLTSLLLSYNSCRALFEPSFIIPSILLLSV